MPGIRTPGHSSAVNVDGLHCACGWTDSTAVTKRARRAAYTEHLAEARRQRRCICRDCGETKDAKRMSVSKPGLCKACSTARTQAWAAANPDEWERHRRKSWLKRKYGITPEKYDERLAKQGGVCAICRQPPGDSRGYKMHVDHCHKSDAVRGILCGPCNRGIGSLGDSPERCIAAAEYLRR